MSPRAIAALLTSIIFSTLVLRAVPSGQSTKEYHRPIWGLKFLWKFLPNALLNRYPGDIPASP